MCAAANGYGHAYVDPGNPEDVVLSVPRNDEHFDEGDGDDEGKADGLYMYGIASHYEAHDKPDMHSPQGQAVAVDVGDGDEDDDFAERPKVQPAGIGIAAPPKSKRQQGKLKRKEKEKEEKEKDNLAQDNPWAPSALSNESLLDNGNPHKQQDGQSQWTLFQD